MSEMPSEIKRQKLQRLGNTDRIDKRRKRILYHLFTNEKGWKIKVNEIVDLLPGDSGGDKTVSADLTQIYRQLDVPVGFDDNLKRKYLLDNWRGLFLSLYPTLEAIEGKSEVSEVGRNAPEVYRHPHPPRTIEVPYWLVAMIGGIFVILIGLVIISFLDRFVLPIFPTSLKVVQAASPTSVLANPSSTSMPVVATVSATSTSTPLLLRTSTQTPIPSDTSTPLPTNTPLPSPVGPIVLFEDNFDNGRSSSWQVVSGNPVIANDALTTDNEATLLVGDSSWVNYSVEFDALNFFHPGVKAGGIVGVRVQDPDNMIAFTYYFFNTFWDVVENGNWSEVPNTRTGVIGYPPQRIKITANGQKYTAEGNDGKISSFVNSKFSSGKILLKIYGGEIVDNLKVTSLP